MQALLDAGPGCAFGHFVVFIGSALHVIHCGALGTVQSGHDHLRQADVFGPGNAIVLIGPQFFNTEMRADATEAVVGENFFEFGAFIFGETAEAKFLVTNRRTQLD